MMKFIEERGHHSQQTVPQSFTTSSPTTKQVMSEEIRKDVLNASEKGKKKYQAFNSEQIIDKTVQFRDTIHRWNLKHDLHQR